MKTTMDIPDREVTDAIRFTAAKSKREAIVNPATVIPANAGIQLKTSLTGCRFSPE
jgi:hypothetical protein